MLTTEDLKDAGLDPYAINTTSAEGRRIAALEGLTVDAATDTDLFLDLDDNAAVERMDANMSLAVELFPEINLYTLRLTPPKSGTGQHARLKLSKPLPVRERIMLQAFLGSDLRREARSLKRVLEGDPEPILLFEKPRPNEYEIDGSYEMLCGQYEAQERAYEKLECQRGVWLIAQQPNSADNVYFDNPRDTTSDGFGGATLSFKLTDGSVYKAKGPWHSNSESLLRDTGRDLRDTHLTFVVIGKDRRYDRPNAVITDVVYKDEIPTLGRFDRYKEIIAGLPKGRYAYYTKTSGGSSHGFVGEVDEDAIEF